jgi:hypothetical protein
MACILRLGHRILSYGCKAEVVSRVLVIGGYGNFGSYIVRQLADASEIQLLIGGRSEKRAATAAQTINAANPVEAVSIDVEADLGAAIAACHPDIVVHTVGPFQRQDYRVARAAIEHGSHYVDLADARDFVTGFKELDSAAQAAGVLAVSGASTVPCLTAAVIDKYRSQFIRLESIDYGISAAQQTNRGLATTAAVLSYIGKPFTSLRDGSMRRVFGWQDLHRHRYPGFGYRWFGNCDIPDLDLFPARYSELKHIRFAAGHELAVLHFGTWLLSWMVRLHLLPAVDRFANTLQQIAFAFDCLGSGNSGFHMKLRGMDLSAVRRAICFTIEARSGHGPFIPCVPVIILARQLAAGQLKRTGAGPCLDMIDLDTYIGALSGLDVSIIVEGADA